MSNPNPSIRVNVDITNPGQFFACCGLLELADRFWLGAEGWFDKGAFCLKPTNAITNASGEFLIRSLADCTLANTMKAEELERLNYLSQMSKKERAKQGLEEEKGELDKLRRELPIVLHAPFNLQIDWFLDDMAGGSRFKTWAGQQSVLDIATSMKSPFARFASVVELPENWLLEAVGKCGLPFNFDSDLGGQGSAVDVGFSFDPLAANTLTRIETTARPYLEFLAFIGLQRFRPLQVGSQNRYIYSAWDGPLPPEIAACVACGAVTKQAQYAFEFRLLYRTKYLKSFLSAIPYSGVFDE